MTKCQFPDETEFIPFIDAHWCRFHLPLRDNPGSLSPKGLRTEGSGWEDGGVEWLAFEKEIFSRLLSSSPNAGITPSRADFRNVIFPAGFDFSKFYELLHGDFSSTIFGDFVNFSNVRFTDFTKFSGNIGKAANFSNTKFGKSADFRNEIFEESANFSGAEFAEDVIFTSATFGGSPNFMGVKFGHSSNFANTVFGKSANFSRATFGDDVVFESSNFGELTNFRCATFGKSVNFSNTPFGKSANFISGKFGKSANFKNAKFEDLSNFSKATFGDNAVLQGATFENDANFTGVVFGNEADLTAAKFQNNTCFNGATFGNNANLSGTTFRDWTIFKDAKFLGKVIFSLGGASRPEFAFRAIDFSSAEFFGPCSFDNRVFTAETLFKGTVFRDLVEFHGCTFHQGMSFHQTKFLKTKGANDSETEALERAYRTLRLGMENLRARNEEAMFFAKEMECYRHRIFFSFDWIVSGLYNILSGYGRSLIRPVFWFLSLTVFSFFLYAWAFYGGAKACPGGPFKYGWEILEFTAEQIFRPFGIWSLPAGEKTPYDAVRVFMKEYHRPLIPFLASLQSLGTFGLLTLFLLALRRRFKMD